MSGAANSLRPSTTITMASASSNASRAWRKISAGMNSFSSGMMPPVSITCSLRWFHSVSPYKRSRVMPGSSPTMARRRPIMRLNSVLLPTLGRPTMAMVSAEVF
jgi:hypothetical protein